MGNDLTTPTSFNALSEPQRKEHRAKIGVRARAILAGFWFDTDTPAAVQALELEGWMDVLENCSHSEIRQAWATYLKTGPRTASGKLYKPDAGALYRIILSARPKPELVIEQEPPRVEPSEDQKRRVDAIVSGFTGRRRFRPSPPEAEHG